MLKFAAMTNKVIKIPPSSEDRKITQTALAGCSCTCYHHNMHTLLYVTLKPSTPRTDTCNQQLSTVMCLPEDALITNQNIWEN